MYNCVLAMVNILGMMNIYNQCYGSYWSRLHIYVQINIFQVFQSTDMADDEDGKLVHSL